MATSENSLKKTWWVFKFSKIDQISEIDSEVALYNLFGSQIEGLIQKDENAFEGYIDSYGKALPELIQEFTNNGFKVIGFEEIQEQNWTAQCPDVFKQIEVGDIQIVPLQDTKSSPQELPDNSSKITIHMIPGFGFGTGHHETTRLCLQALQLKEVKELGPKNVLDMGTGNGILSIACAKLYGSKVSAVDIDNEALINAKDNISINEVGDNIILSNTPSSDNFNLIIANIYAEVLVLLEKDFRSRISPGGILILSGIVTPLLHLVREGFTDKYWDFKGGSSENEWHMIWFKAK